MGQPTQRTLRDVAIFRGLTEPARMRLERLCTWKSYHRGKNIIDVYDVTRDVFFLVAGRARVIMYSVAGKPVSFREIGPGDMVGELAAIDGGPRSSSVEVIAAALVASLSAADFRAMLRAEPLVMEAVLVHAVAQIRALTARVFEFSTLAVNNRIHAELLRLARGGQAEGGKVRIFPFPKHGEIASRISTHREAVTRRLNDLEKQRLIERDGATLLINDVRELEQMVQNAAGE
jgi:CRP-like cAMP-binding protein